MINFIEKIAQIFLTQQEHLLQLRELKVEFVRNQKGILHNLRLCKKSGGIIGLYCARLGKGMCLAVVSGVNDSFVTIRPVDDSERVQHEGITIPIKDISAICPFNQIYSETHQEEALEELPAPLKMMHIN